METMQYSRLEPKSVFHYFQQLSQIPCGSGDQTRVSQWVADFAREQGLPYRQDAMGNVVIWKAASSGYEQHPAVMLQGHLDMVCVAESGKNHDFTRDPLTLVVDGDPAGKERITGELLALSQRFGGSYGIRGEYPAWEFMPQSALRDTMAEVYRQQYGCEMKVETIHAGLECGILVNRMPGLDAVSIGPDLRDVHSTRERLSIPSTGRVWQYVCSVLAAL